MSDALAEVLTPKVLDSFDRLRGDCALWEGKDTAIIELRGEDRKGWLQGQATNDLKQLDLGAALSFCLCTPTGQLLAICDIWGLRDRFLLTCESSACPAFLRRVEDMVILEDVQARDVTGEFELLSIQGPGATSGLADLVELPTLDAADSTAEGIEVTVLRSNRTGLGGWDVLVPKREQAVAERIRAAFRPVAPQAYDIARLEAGVPLAGRDWDAKTLPPELGPAFEARHISYKKGCYTGQEVLMRIYSRGHTNRTWVALLSEKPLSPGATIRYDRREGIGTVTSAAFSPDYGYIAGAMLRNDAALQGESVTVGDIAAEVRHMPILRFD